jgi:integrase
MGGEPVTVSSMLDSAGRRRSPATLPGFHAGRAPRNKGMRYPSVCVIDGPTRGRAWSASAVRGELRRHAAEAGVRRRFAPHQLRHAHAVELAREGVSLNVIQRQPAGAGARGRAPGKRGL